MANQHAVTEIIAQLEEQRMDPKSARWHIEPNALSNTKVEHAVAQWLDPLVQAHEPRAILFAGRHRLASLEASIAAIAEHGSGVPGAYGAAQTALWWLSRTDPVVDLTRVVAHGPTAEGLEVLYALAKDPTRDAIPTLLSGLSHPNVVLRQHALTGLIRLMGVHPDPPFPGTPIGRLQMLVGSALPSLREAGVIELESKVEAWLAGATAEQLGISTDATAFTPEGKRFWFALFDDDYDKDMLDALVDDERAWAEMALRSRLQYGDERSLALLLAIRAPDLDGLLADAVTFLGDKAPDSFNRSG